VFTAEAVRLLIFHSMLFNIHVMCSQAELLDSVALNIHRIDKDVHRCDRNNAYFVSTSNLEKLRNIMCTYVHSSPLCEPNVQLQ